MDQYYYGQANAFSQHGVQYSLDTIVQSLEVNKDRHFTFAEQV